MTTFHTWFNDTHFVLDLPQYSALAPSTGLVALVGCATLVRTRSGARAVSIVVGIFVSLVVYWATRGVFPLIGGRVAGSPHALFPRVFEALALLGAACAWSVCVAGASLLDRVARRANGREFALSILALALSLGGFAYVARLRGELGPPQRPLPVLIGAANWRVQAGASIRASTQLGHRDVGGWFFRRGDVALGIDELARLRATCFDCEREITGVTVGRNVFVLRARVGPYALHRQAAYDVEDSRGNARFPLRVGARWVFRDRLEATTRAGGWAIAMADGLSHLTPEQQRANHLGERRRELRVERSFVENGIRFWELHHTDGARERIVVAYGQNGQTWVPEDRNDPWRRRQPLIEGAPERNGGDERYDRYGRYEGGIGAGVFSCRIHGLDFNYCGDGSNPRIPRGPVHARIGDSSGRGLFIAAVTLGAVVPGAGPRWAYCLESFTEGSGVEMPVWTHNVQPLPSRDPRGERFALCDPPAGEAPQRPAPSTRAQRMRERRAPSRP